MSATDDAGNDALEHARSQLGEALTELSASGVLDERIMEARPAWILPFQIVIGQSRISSGDTSFIWVIGGKVPADCLPSNAAQTPREAARHFSLKWQLDSESLAGEEAMALIRIAEHLYSIVDNDDYWS
jgi:hypothetical protein